MLNAIVVIIFENTNLNDLRCVESTISELERWFVIASGKSGSQDGNTNSYMHMVVKRIKAEKTLPINVKRVFTGEALVSWLLEYEGDKFGGEADDDNTIPDDAKFGEAPAEVKTDTADGAVDRSFAQSFCDDMLQVCHRLSVIREGT